MPRIKEQFIQIVVSGGKWNEVPLIDVQLVPVVVSLVPKAKNVRMFQGQTLARNNLPL